MVIISLQWVSYDDMMASKHIQTIIDGILHNSRSSQSLIVGCQLNQTTHRQSVVQGHLTPWDRDKWPPFCTRPFQMHFFEWKCMNIDWNFTVPKGPISNISALVQIMAWHPSGDKPLSEPMMASLTDEYMRHSAPWAHYRNLAKPLFL